LVPRVVRALKKGFGTGRDDDVALDPFTTTGKMASQ
jgi:hypothetical protein